MVRPEVVVVICCVVVKEIGCSAYSLFIFQIFFLFTRQPLFSLCQLPVV